MKKNIVMSLSALVLLGAFGASLTAKPPLLKRLKL